MSVQELGDRLLAEPTGVIFIYPGIAAQAIDEVVDTEGVRGGQDQEAVWVEMSPCRREEPTETAQVLDQLTGEHHVESTPEVEVLGIPEHDVVSALFD
jgi:hypothetical protein